MKYPILKINLPNFITIVRILLTPLFIIFLLREMFVQAIIVFTVASISDALDGYIARFYNQRTELGAYLDPIADKFLLMASYVSLGILKFIPGWLAVIVISRDIVIMAGIAVLTMMDIKLRIQPIIISKITTCAQLISVFLTLFYPEDPCQPFLKYVFYWITAFLTTLSGLHYMLIGLNTLQNDENRMKNQ